MAPASNRKDPVQRLRFLRYGLIVAVVTAFTIAAITSLYSQMGNVGPALVQGLIWGVGTAVVAVIVYLAYQKIALKK